MIDDYLDLNKVIPVSIFYIIIFIIMFRTDTMYVNPYFLIFRIKIFKVTLPSGRSVVVVTDRQEILNGENLTLYAIESSKLYYSPRN